MRGSLETSTPTAVAFGGGHGLSASLSALRHLTERLTAIVTVADDGGSSGRIREQVNVLPPGDLRMALAALCDTSDWGMTWSNVMQHRFQTDPNSKLQELEGHALGNLLIVALWQMFDDPVVGLDWVGKLLGARGRVLPMALEPLEIRAEVEKASGKVQHITGQARVAKAGGKVKSIELVPSNPQPCPQALQAIGEADWIVLGPGSWYTSVIPHLLISSLADAIANSPAKVCLTMNLTPSTEESQGQNEVDLLHEFMRYFPRKKIHAVVADPAAVYSPSDLAAATRSYGARLLLRQVSVAKDEAWHDPLRLAAAYRDVFSGTYADVS